MTRQIVIVGVPTALGGHLPGMEQTPAGLRKLGLIDALRAALRPAETEIDDTGDLTVEPGFRVDDDRRAKNRSLICEFLPREGLRVVASLAEAGPDPRLLILGGDCTAHAGALAGLRAWRPGARLALAWFDAHGDFNTPDTTRSGNVWGMPFAMICGRGDPDLVAASGGPTIRAEDAALLGGQILNETESRILAASRIAHFGSGMLADDAGMAAFGAWTRAVSGRVDGVYVAFDMDCLDAAGGWAVTMPEPNGLALETVTKAVGILAGAMPVVGFGATGITLANGDAAATSDAVAAVAAAAFVSR
jgi:arginase